ncbi:MAG TPA: DEAD/DEAH box helicase family protein [Sedimentisphaerales bacterium]|nr:DEAD/DEAH box helicase family protein [Sedimentisphaerales bacterium]
MAKEAKARIKINKLLEEAGWRFFDDENGPANICLENNVKITKTHFDEFGEDFEKTTDGYIDFLLLDNKGFPYVVLEAKSEEKNPLDGKEQARRYAKSSNARFVILSNGNLHYFWDMEKGNPTIITSFPTPESLAIHKDFIPNPQTLVSEPVDDDYIVLTQKPDYVSDPRWLDETQRSNLIKDNDLKFLRPYQKRAVQSIQESVKEGNDRFLIEMATGTGKTLIAAAVIKLFLRTANAKRVLFLVDRLELEDQAWKNFKRYLKNDCKAVIYKQNREDWRKAEIVVSTVQSLLVNNKYQDLFSPIDFDLVISDEAHRSIGGNSRAVFEYFVGYKLGLTATPKDYLKNIPNINERDPREIERRLLMDTYRTFGCETGEPTYRYSLLDGVAEKWLINPIVADARTEITTQLLSDQGYSVIVVNEDGEEEEAFFTHRDFERKFFSEKTNRIFSKTFIENALRDPLSGEIGKSIFFCVSQNHAARITKILNEYADQAFPGKYNSDFAVQVTSRIPGSQQFTINFTNNNLNGKTRFLDTYNSSKTRVCVTVGMMTTGYDCQDILNLCLLRPIFSPTDFVQIKGRGTRKYSFSYKRRNDLGEMEEVEVAKENFKIFDFFANFEYFEEKYNYDQVLELPRAGTGEGGGDGIDIDAFTSVRIDPLKTMEVTAIGLEGMRVDRELFGDFAEAVKKDEFVTQKVEEGDFKAAEDHIREEVFDKPEEYYNLEKLRKAARVDRRISLREILEKIFGLIPGFKSKEELLDEECNKFISIHKPGADYVMPIKNFLKAYIMDSEIRDIVETRQYARFATSPVVDDFRALTKQWRNIIPEYVKDYVVLNRFM